jgi:hypothetical protein
MIMSKKIVYAIICCSVLIIVAIIYVSNMSKAEWWLLGHKNMATKYAQHMLDKSDVYEKVPDEMIDMQISTFKDAVMFAPNDQDNMFVLVYSLKPLSDKFKINKDTIALKKLKEGWYEVRWD